MNVSPLDLAGRWTMSRIVHDRAAALFGHVTGHIEFNATDDRTVRWSEQGRFVWGARTVDVSRELVVVRAGTSWVVCFEDGREFHEWTTDRAVVHPCRADTYCGRIHLDAELTRLRVLWDVTGPAKDQRLFTRARRHA